ncbi:hypothetical protein FRC07_005200 [Ceratobasidium sp. 392]|nr:hypothetical protein FRC07_005200 [Ceratobasidium sp. 392]
MRAPRLLQLSGLVSLAAAASLGDIPQPKAPLTWGDVNVFHTTDIHGWILGHPKPVFPELNWSGTFGDFYSFMHHMRKKAEDEKKDLLLVDAGDRRVGHGLTDRLIPGTVNGQLVVEMYQVIGYDAVTPGNHDIDDPAVVEWVKKDLSKQWGDRFITSNIRQNTTTNYEPQRDPRPFYGASHRYWTTEHTKRKILAYGVTTSGTRVQKSKGGHGLLDIIPLWTMVKQDWFLKSLENDVDVFIVVGHMDPEKPCNDDGWIHIYNAIREKHPLTPIMMFAGHTHKRACTRFTSAPIHFKRSMLLQSGQYFDTVGWMSTSLDGNKPPGADLKMTRRYLDNNVVTYKFHTGKENDEEFHIPVGIAMTDRVYGIERAEGLSQLYGFLPGDYFLDRKTWDPSDKQSMFNLYLDAAQSVLIDKSHSKNWLFFSNWGIVRGDLYRGEFTLGDLYSVSPNDPKHFLTVKVKRSVADQVVSTLQQRPSKSKCPAGFAPSTLGDSKQMVRPTESAQLLHGSRSERRAPVVSANSTRTLTLGWKTLDVCGDEGENTPYGDGDDVEHEPIPKVSFDDGPPVYFWRKSWEGDSTPADEEVDLVFTNYIGKDVPGALNSIIDCKPPYTGCTPFTSNSLKNYTEDLRQDQLLGTYVRKIMKTIPDDYPMPV